MTGSKVLIVKLPELHADVKMLEAFRAYVCDALGAGALVLPLGTTYAVEEFPALGAVCREGVERESGHLCPVEPVLVGKGAGLDDQALRGLWAGRLEALSHAAQRREV